LKLYGTSNSESDKHKKKKGLGETTEDFRVMVSNNLSFQKSTMKQESTSKNPYEFYDISVHTNQTQNMQT